MGTISQTFSTIIFQITATEWIHKRAQHGANDEERLVERIPQIRKNIYLATGTDDIKGLMESTEDLNTN